MTIRFNWGTGIAATYALFALATIGFVAFAMTQTVELVSDDYYADALRHDAHMTALQQTQSLGDAFTITERHEAGEVVVRWPRHLASRVTGQAVFYRPSSAAADITVALTPDADGRQVLSTGGLARGRWQLKLAWAMDGRDYRATRDLNLP